MEKGSSGERAFADAFKVLEVQAMIDKIYVEALRR
jgi:hypothetical protein